MIPQSLKELQEVIALHHKLVSEIAEREATFPVIRDQYGILCKLNNEAFSNLWIEEKCWLIFCLKLNIFNFFMQ